MSTLLNDFPCIHHIDRVCVLDGRKASVALSLALPLTGNMAFLKSKLIPLISANPRE